MPPENHPPFAAAEFSMACWDIDGDKKVTYHENVIVLSVTETEILLIDDKGIKVATNPNCIIEATEKFSPGAWLSIPSTN